jgi:hypothetical protein
MPPFGNKPLTNPIEVARERWALEQGLHHAVAHFYGCGLLKRCASGHFITNSVALSVSLGTEFQIHDIGWEPNSYVTVCHYCGGDIEPYGHNPQDGVYQKPEEVPLTSS